MSSVAVVFSRTLLAGAGVHDGEVGVGVPLLADRGTAQVRDGLLTVTLPRAAR